MLAVCQKDPTHDRFITVAHVAEDWIVDKHGNFEESLDEPHEVVANPDKDNTWTCRICDTEARVFDCDPDTPIGQCPNCKAYGPVEEGCPTCPGFWFTDDEAEVAKHDAFPDGQTMTIDQVIADITDVLQQADGEFVEGIARQVLSKHVEYEEDGFFKYADRCDHCSSPLMKGSVDGGKCLICGGQL